MPQLFLHEPRFAFFSTQTFTFLTFASLLTYHYFTRWIGTDIAHVYINVGDQTLNKAAFCKGHYLWKEQQNTVLRSNNQSFSTDWRSIASSLLVHKLVLASINRVSPRRWLTRTSHLIRWKILCRIIGPIHLELWPLWTTIKQSQSLHQMSIFDAFSTKSFEMVEIPWGPFRELTTSQMDRRGRIWRRKRPRLRYSTY